MTTCMLYVTAGSPEEARTLSNTLVSEGLAACVNIVDGAASVYQWQGRVETEQESILFIKTTLDKRPAAMERLKELHSYDTPCIVSYDMSGGNPEYIDWVLKETSNRD